MLEVLRRHARQAAIVYCLSRRDTEELAGGLAAQGLTAAHYHAGMDAAARRHTQEAFAEERLDIVVATVAFGMGIDRSDVRCVIHAGLPKSIEHYQQETGRAGRDGLEAECVLLYSPADVIRLERLIEKSAAEAGVRRRGRRGQPRAAPAHAALRRRPARAVTARCRSISDRRTRATGCGACDVCLNEVEGVADATVTAQKILSCVARAGQGFGILHIVDILTGANSARIRQWRHDTLSTYGLLTDVPRNAVTTMVHQLLDQRLLDRTPGDRPVLKLNDTSWAVLRGQRAVQLVLPRQGPVAKPRFDEDSWEGVDKGLFEHLRQLRRALADARGVPPYIIFGDATLRDLARLRPSTPAAFATVRGVGQKKLEDLGPEFLAHIRQYCEANGLGLDARASG